MPDESAETDDPVNNTPKSNEDSLKSDTPSKTKSDLDWLKGKVTKTEVS